MNQMTLVSWNVNGLRALEGKGFLDWLKQNRPDILCLQETKAHPDQLSEVLLAPEGYRTYWSASERRGYSGVAIYTREEPRSVSQAFSPEYDREGRTLIADYGSFVLLTSYVPNGSRDHSRVPFKMAYKRKLLEVCEALRGESRSVVVCGDINTAHRPIDLARPAQNRNTTGFLPEERAWIDEFLELGYLDTFRAMHPDRVSYSWWAYWGGARERNVGWRLDYFFVSPDLWPSVQQAEIHPEVLGSDHCPVSLTLSLP